MNFSPLRLIHWLESHWVTPAYGGWVLLGVSLFFFGAATNTMAGWLYVISGMMMALLSISSILPQQALKGLTLERQPILPVTAGQNIRVEITVTNQTAHAKALLLLHDQLPQSLQKPLKNALNPEGQPIGSRAIAAIGSRRHYDWRYEIPTQRRGLYRWQRIQLRTAAPLGLFWCSRLQTVSASAVVYPQGLSLTHCPILDSLGHETGQQWHRDRTTHAGNEGLTKALRPYRWGDPTRLIHWRTSARYGELRVRELERLSSAQEIVIALDTTSQWHPDDFEQAVIAAASLSVYALQREINSRFWSAATGYVHGRVPILTALASITNGQSPRTQKLAAQPVLWLSPEVSPTLPSGSRYILFPTHPLTDTPVQQASVPQRPSPGMGLIINRHENLQQQLQKAAN